MIATRRRQPGTTHARRATVLFLLVLVQASIGIGTLLMHVPMHMALTHQGFALIVLGFAAAHWRGTGAYPLPKSASDDLRCRRLKSRDVASSRDRLSSSKHLARASEIARGSSPGRRSFRS